MEHRRVAVRIFLGKPDDEDGRQTRTRHIEIGAVGAVIDRGEGEGSKEGKKNEPREERTLVDAGFKKNSTVLNYNKIEFSCILIKL